MGDYMRMIQNLRVPFNFFGPRSNNQVADANQQRRQAATAIGTLVRERDEARADARAWSEKSLKYVGEANAQIAKLKAENARLREALEHADQHIGQSPVGEDAPDYVRYAHVMLAEIRQALGEPND